MRFPHRITVPIIALFAIAAIAGGVAADDPLPATVTKYCKPTESAVFFGSRYHVRCQSPLNVGRYGDVAVSFFSIADSDQSRVEQAMAIVNTAMAHDKSVRLWVHTASSQNPSGCLPGDCRRFFGIALVN